MNSNNSETAISSEIQNLAYCYAKKLDWPVLPLHGLKDGRCTCGKSCKSPGKHPITLNGLKDASVDPKRIETWFKNWPDANIGIVTGAVSGIFVLDVDPKNGGLDSLDKLVLEHGSIPDDVLAITGSSGRHYVFQYPGKIGRSTTNIWPGIDTRGDGGYIVAAPSGHVSGNDYFWDAEADPTQGAIPAPVPAWLLKKLDRKKSKKKTKNHNNEVTSSKLNRIRSALAKISSDDRDNWLKVGMALHSTGFGDRVYKIWCEWSEQSEKFDDVDQLRVWRSFKSEGGVSLGSLFDLAKEHGWESPLPELPPEPPIEAYDNEECVHSNQKNNFCDGGFFERYIFLSSQNRIFCTITNNLMTREGFDNYLLHEYKKPKASSLLLSNRECIKVDGLIYLPGTHDNPIFHDSAKRWNIWIPPKLNLPKSADDQDIEPWLEHLVYLCPCKTEQNHILDWLAFTLQSPGVKINHALLIAGTPRIGKDTLFNPLRYGLGERNICEPSATELSEQYTDYLHHAKLVIFQEVMNFDGLNLENKLKPILASPPDMLRVRLFGRGFYETPNIVQAIFMSNYREALHISEGDGRYFAIWADASPLSETYYRNLWEWLNNGGNGLVVSWLLNRNISGFNPKETAPMSQFKAELIESSQSPVKHQLNDMIQGMDYPFNVDCVRSLDVVKALRNQYSLKTIGTVLSEVGSIKKSCRRSSGKRETLNLFAVRNIDKWKVESSVKWIDEFDKRKE